MNCLQPSVCQLHLFADDKWSGSTGVRTKRGACSSQPASQAAAGGTWPAEGRGEAEDAAWPWSGGQFY